MFSVFEHLFIYLLAICMSSLEKSYIDPLPIFFFLRFFFSIELSESLVYFEYLSLSGYVVQIFYLIPYIAFSLYYGLFASVKQKLFSLM